MTERLAIVGSGAIACGLAATAAHHGPVLLLTRSDESAKKASARVKRTLEKLGAKIDPTHVKVTTSSRALADATFVVESVVEHEGVKCGLLAELSGLLGDDAILATTTSSLSVERLSRASGRPDRFVGLHVFNPVTKMELVELAFPQAATEDTKARTLSLCSTLEKTAICVPDISGFVVNRLLFPYLMSAVRLLEETAMPPEDIDTCMTLGAGHPMGPLALLDYVGLDVASAICEELGVEIPSRVAAMIAAGELGRKSGRGFSSYEQAS